MTGQTLWLVVACLQKLLRFSSNINDGVVLQKLLVAAVLL
jgi:hypothetical protein